MALINDTIPADYFQLIRDKIAAILLDELSNQFTLSGNKDFDLSQIWNERRRPFNLSELPAVNLSIGPLSYGAKFGLQRQPEVMYWIDVYNSKLYTDDADADALSSDGAWSMLRAVQFILDHASYRTLELSPYVMHTECVRITPGEAEMSDGARCSILRLEFQVKTQSIIPANEPINWALSDSKVKIGTTELGYFYQLIKE